MDNLIPFVKKYNHLDNMHLSIFVDSDDESLKEQYIKAAELHNQKILEDSDFCDAGFDIFLPESILFEPNKTTKVDFKIKCCAILVKTRDLTHSYYSPFYTYARSSISKTPLRLANNQGVIDAGYRGNLIGMFDCLMQESNWEADKFTRLLQICAPGLIPIYRVDIVNSIEDLGPVTKRGEGGIGSTGK